MKHSSIKIHPGGDQPITKSVGQLSVDIFQNKDEIIILAPIAGVAENDLSLTINNEVLAIKGVRKPPFTPSEDDYYTKECFWGEFSRAIVLPEEADSKKITANFNNNVLEIHIPKNAKKGPQVIKIKNS